MLLIEAEDEAAAQKKAESLGRDGEAEYSNAANETVKWRFDRIERIFPIERQSIGDGTQLFCRHLRDSEVQSILTPFDDPDE